MSINWKKGFSRAWLVFAIVWWVGGLIMFFHLGSEGEFRSIYGQQNVDWDFVLGFLSLWILTPLVVAGIWKTGAWIIHGFLWGPEVINPDGEE
tara:strand:- start:65 stop:343 length:279 start_codon:yes stop_codon:yes gene_type:complete